MTQKLGHLAFKLFFTVYFIRFTFMFPVGKRTSPDYKIHVEDITAKGDFVILLAVFKGTYKVDFHGIPASFRRVKFPIMVKYQILDDKIVNAWPMFDQLSIFEQPGELHKPA